MAIFLVIRSMSLFSTQIDADLFKRISLFSLPCIAPDFAGRSPAISGKAEALAKVGALCLCLNTFSPLRPYAFKPF